ncbi:MAG: hypothetical protein WC869_16695, partial [Phycisphaerae bacterium]
MSANENTRENDATDQEIRRVCAILESVAKNYTSGSDEATAIRDAALAYIVVHQREALKKAYSQLRRAFRGELSEDMKAQLRRHGIEPDDLD